MQKALGSEHTALIGKINQLMRGIGWEKSPLGSGFNKCSMHLIGGAVRDILSGQIPRDFDFATSASPSQIVTKLKTFTWGPVQIVPGSIRNYFEMIDEKGVKTASIDETKLYLQLKKMDSYELQGFRPMVSAKLYDTNTKKTWDFEIASYQIYLTPTKTEENNFMSRTLMVKTLEEHLSNLDFTVNSIAMDENGNLVDLYGGVEDIENKILKSLIKGKEKFEEQPRTMLRAIKLLASQNYKLDDDTKKSLSDAHFEKYNTMRPSMKRILISEILNFKGGIQLLNKYGINKKVWDDYGSELDVEIMKRITKGFNNLNKYLKPSKDFEINISNDASYILYNYFISESFKDIKDKVALKLSEKHKISPNIAKVIYNYNVFNPNSTLTKQFTIFFKAIETYLSLKSPSELYKVKEILDELIKESNLMPSDLLRCFNPVIISISLDKGLDLEGVFNRNKFLYSLYSKRYQKLIKYKNKAAKHIYSYYGVTEEKSNEIVKDLISSCLMDKSIPANWEYLLTNTLSEKYTNLNFPRNIKDLCGILDNNKNYDYAMEKIIHNYCKHKVNDSISLSITEDDLKYIDWYEDFADEINEWEDREINNIEFFRKVLNLLIFSWKINYTPENKKEKIDEWTNNWFSYTLDDMLFNDSKYIEKNRDIKTYRKSILDELNKTEKEDYEDLKITYKAYIDYAYELWVERHTNIMNEHLDEARDVTIQLLKNEDSYSSFFPDNIIINENKETISQLGINKYYNKELLECLKCGSKDFHIYVNKDDGVTEKRCIMRDCYEIITHNSNLKYVNNNLIYEDLDWLIFSENSYVHRPIISDIYQRLQLSLNSKIRKTLRYSKNDYNDFKFQCQKHFNNSFKVIDVTVPNYEDNVRYSKLLTKIRRKMLDINIKNLRVQLIKKKVFSKSDFDNSLGSDDSIYENSLIFDWILFNTDNSYKLTKIDFIRSILDSTLRHKKMYAEFLPIQREYFDLVQNNSDKDKLKGKLYNDISRYYYMKLRSILNDDNKLIDSKIWKTHKHILEFLNDDNWFKEYFIQDVVPIFYAKGIWVDLEKTIYDGENKLTILNELTSIIYSILMVHNPSSWGDVAKIYNELPIDKMEFGLLTANLAKYIYDKCIKPYEAKV